MFGILLVWFLSLSGSLTTARGWILALLRLLTARNDAAQAVDRFRSFSFSHFSI
jgi:hypothetical protein